MARPKPQVLLEIVDKKTYVTEQVLYADGIWTVFYKNKPINLKTQSIVSTTQAPKYKKIAHSNKGHAINLAKKLNAKFKTTDFTVVLLTAGTQIFP